MARISPHRVILSERSSGVRKLLREVDGREDVTAMGGTPKADAPAMIAATIVVLMVECMDYNAIIVLCIVSSMAPERQRLHSVQCVIGE
mmetsp:Transcript_17995/g.31011  ORF Transcript_17995/g.31011 Transcript_17995/m.31011 type:complete len:89 (+) Transcript_17995:328-594(+)